MFRESRARFVPVTTGLVVAVLLALPMQAVTLFNGNFENVGAATDSFAIDLDFALPNWTSNPAPTGNHILNCLIFAGDTTDLCGPTAFGGGFTFWVNPGPSPAGGKYVAIDGDQNFANPLQQTVTGLSIGTHYNVTFYQAAAQQSSFNGATTERWQVSLGAESHLSTLMNNANHGAVGWMSQTLSFTATATSEVLSFLAIGTPNGLPPFVLLDGVTMDAATPEPESFVMVGLGLASIPFLGKLLRKRRAARSQENRLS